MCFNFLHIKNPGITTTRCAIAQKSAFLIVQQIGIKYYICNIVARKMYTIKFLNRFSENTQISNFMKIRPVEAKLFHANARTDRTVRHTRQSQWSLFAISERA
jgi:hypothetical protein